MKYTYLACCVLIVLFAFPIAANAIATIDVTAYGAKCDGKTDDTASLRAAAAAVPDSGAVLQFPKGTCLIRATIYLKSHTHVEGNGATILAAAPFHTDYITGGALFENVNHDAVKISDTDYRVSDLTFDYGSFAPIGLRMGGKHAVRFQFASDIEVANCIFYCRGAEDAVAGIGVANMLVQGNRAYEFRNCAYDFWGGSTNVRILENYAETEKSAQVINFNPDLGGKNDRKVPLEAKGLTVIGNTFIVTGPGACGSIISPLGLDPGSSVRDVLIANNTLTNNYLVLRGDVQHAVVTGNTFSDLGVGPASRPNSNPSVLTAYPNTGGTGDSIIFSYNRIVNPHTQTLDVAVLRLNATNSFVIGNTISGATYTAAPISTQDCGKFNVTVDQNIVTGR